MATWHIEASKGRGVILFKGRGNATNKTHLIALFGIGLVGSAIALKIEDLLGMKAFHMSFDWETRFKQQKHLLSIVDLIVSFLKRAPDSRFDVIWSAGRSGFSASRKQTELESANFQTVLDLADLIAERFPRRIMQFHFISSAGGLFEGQRHVNPGSQPKPMRPYGALKLEQEKRIRHISGLYRKHIYRPSTLYGRIGDGLRRGLISTLILNGVRNRITTITGNMATIRDFVATNDLSAFIVSKVVGLEGQSSNIYMLVSSKPTTILEIKQHIEDLINRKLYINNLLNPTNDLDNSFAPEVMPENWYPSSLKQNIRIIYQQVLGKGVFLKSLFV